MEFLMEFLDAIDCTVTKSWRFGAPIARIAKTSC
jgi:hypothetical protein